MTDRYLDEYGRIVHGEPKTGEALAEGKKLLARGTVDLSLLDEKVEQLCGKLLLTFPECLTKSFEELRKPKLDAWNRNKENSRAWLALNMMAEARTRVPRLQRGAEGSSRDRLRRVAPIARQGRALDRGSRSESLIPKAGGAR